MIDLIKNFSCSVRRTRSSAIRELLELVDSPHIISFGGGLPSPSSFPVAEISTIVNQILKEDAARAFQYGPTDGIVDLKDEVIKFLKKEENLSLTRENILITSSSQQALDIVGRTFIDPSDPILMELPSYLSAIQAFGSCGAKMVGVKMDRQGIILHDLEEKLLRLKDEEEHYKFLYLVPDFQNPAGITMGLERREAVVELAQKYQVLIVEDTPYRQVRFAGKSLPMLQRLDDHNNTISIFTFSKILFPALRLGFIIGPAPIIKKMIILKQAMDLCSSSFLQMIVARYLKANLLDEHLKIVAREYGEKKAAMVNALGKYMPTHPEIQWTNPEGGLFLWLMLPSHIDTATLFPDALKEQVAYVIGQPFHCDGSGKNSMRLNFSFSSLAQIEEGIKRLGGVVKMRLATGV